MKKMLFCLDCGHIFSLSANEIKRYKLKGLHIPTHCPMCRNITWHKARKLSKRASKYERSKNNGRV